MKIQTWIDIINGKKEIHEKEKFQESLNSLQDGRYIYTIEKVENIRSLNQNNAIWGIPYAFFHKVLINAGHYETPSKEQVHEFCMHYCLPDDYKERLKEGWNNTKPLIDIRTGELFKSAFRLTTKKMTTIDASNYYANMQKFYAEYFASGKPDDMIPDPIHDFKKK